MNNFHPTKGKIKAVFLSVMMNHHEKGTVNFLFQGCVNSTEAVSRKVGVKISVDKGMNKEWHKYQPHGLKRSWWQCIGLKMRLQAMRMHVGMALYTPKQKVIIGRA